MDVQVINVDPVTRRVSFKLQPRIVTGISKLIQIVVISLMNTPGRDVLDPSKGGGLPSLVNFNVDSSNTTEIFAEVAMQIKKTQAEVIAAQIPVNDSPEEKLSDLQIVSLSNGAELDDILVTIRVINQAGQASNILL